MSGTLHQPGPEHRAGATPLLPAYNAPSLPSPPSTTPTSFERYVAELPDGLDSYPTHRIKAAFTRSLLEEIPAQPLGLLGPVGALVDHPPVISAWIPEVHHQALILAVVDQVYAGEEDAFLAMMSAMQRRLLSSKIYAPLLQLVSPARLLKQASKRWTSFHQGTTLDVIAVEDTEARLRIEHPPGLFSAVGRRGLASGFCAAIEVARSQAGEVRVAEAGRDFTEFAARWS